MSESGTGPQPGAPEGDVSETQPPQAAGSLVVGSLVELRKPHACGGVGWKIERVGADVALVCDTCGRRVLLPRQEFQRRLRRVISGE
ncbi:MAG: hypothetical protein K0Q72_5272 [Armatimonadetes bacterium]|jgi:hypothetical protein|nr:hypothetical protein [Armatimonadota bacterium]